MSAPAAPAAPAAPFRAAKAPPHLLLHDWHGESPVSSPSYIRANFEYLDSLPFDGIVTYVRSADTKTNISASVLGTRALVFDDVAACLQPLRDLRFANLTENFAAVLGGKPPDFMDDWSVPILNFAILAKAAREAGLRGIYLDNEGYHKPWGDHPKGVSHPKKSVAEYQERARLRGREVMEAMVEQFPDIVVVVLHGPYLSDRRAPAPLFPKWQHRNELVGPFFAGLVEGAGDRGTVVDGGEMYHLRSEAEFRESYAWRKNALPVDNDFIPPGVRDRWASRVRVSFGVYNRPYEGIEMNPEILATTLGHALRRAEGYVWLYVEGPSFLRRPGQGGPSPEWIEAVRRARGPSTHVTH